MERELPIEIPYEALAEFCRANGITRLSLFGSVVRDDFAPDSDIDVLVEFADGVHLGFHYFEIQDDLARLLGRPVDLLMPEGLSKYFRSEVLDQAQVIYDAA